MGLDFDILRRANKERLKTFRNSNGDLAHSTDDGSDWDTAQWFAAMAGEFGEFQEVLLNMALGKSVGMMGENIKKFVRGDYDQEAFLSKFSNEAADIVIYLDIMCRLAGIELGDAVMNKFNATSRKVGSPVNVDVAGSPGAPPQPRAEQAGTQPPPVPPQLRRGGGTLA